MRRPSELLFRARQELNNLWLWARPPVFDGEAAWPLALPPGAAEQLELPPETKAPLEWRRDAVNDKLTGPTYFRFIPYLDVSRAGDHKVIWEPNRHQHLVTLAREHRLDEIQTQLESWWAQNPYQRGINWSSALEVAFRAFSWIWIYEFVGGSMPPDFRRRFLLSLYQHGCHIENNLSYYFSPNTHLLGEGVVLHSLGKLFPAFPRARQWEQLGGEVSRAQMHRQVHDDGSHFERSTYYHRYAFAMLRFHATLSPPRPGYKQKLGCMEEFLRAVQTPNGSLPLLGDDDGGQWLGPALPSGSAPAQSKLFPYAGLAVMRSGAAHILFDWGPFGPGKAAHTHADTLNLVVTHGEEEILIDPGTYTYVGDPKWRNWFRGTAAHNTICINGLDQATPNGPFAWDTPPKTELHDWATSEREDFAEGECHYRGFSHRRSVRFTKPGLLTIEDEVKGPAGEHDLEQRWHLGSEAMRERLTLSGPAELKTEWRSRVFGQMEPVPVLVLHRKTALPTRFTTTIRLCAG